MALTNRRTVPFAGWRSLANRLISLAALAAVAATVQLPLTSAQFSDSVSNGANTFGGSALVAPAGVTATGGAGEVHLGWTQTTSAFADGYQIWRSTSSSCCYTAVGSVAGLTTTSFVDQTVISGTTYYYVVRSRHLTWSSPSSTEVDAASQAGLLALYNFDEGSGTTVSDTSGFGTALDLAIADSANVTWGTGSLAINVSTLISNADSSKIVTAAQATDELTMEAWVTPVNITQGGPSRFVTISANTGSRNATLGQEFNGVELRVNTTSNSGNGLPALVHAGSIPAPALYHVVGTRDSTGWIRLYVNGVEVDSRLDGGTFASWTTAGYSVGLANEMTMDRPWLGTMYRVALYDQALTAGEVATLHSLGH